LTSLALFGFFNEIGKASFVVTNGSSVAVCLVDFAQNFKIKTIERTEFP
jgi:hypothetical protein